MISHGTPLYYGTPAQSGWRGLGPSVSRCRRCTQSSHQQHAVTFDNQAPGGVPAPCAETGMEEKGFGMPTLNVNIAINFENWWCCQVSKLQIYQSKYLKQMVLKYILQVHSKSESTAAQTSQRGHTKNAKKQQKKSYNYTKLTGTSAQYSIETAKNPA